MSEENKPTPTEESKPQEETSKPFSVSDYLPSVGVSEAFCSASSYVASQTRCACEAYYRFHNNTAVRYTGKQLFGKQ